MGKIFKENKFSFLFSLSGVDNLMVLSLLTTGANDTGTNWPPSIVDTGGKVTTSVFDSGGKFTVININLGKNVTAGIIDNGGDPGEDDSW